MKRFTFQIIIEESNDEFWESVDGNPGKAIEDLQTMITECLSSTELYDAEIRLIEFTDKE